MRYTVKDTHIRHGDRTYGPGETVELTEEEAVPITHHLEPVEAIAGPADDSEDSGEDRKRRKK